MQKFPEPSRHEIWKMFDQISLTYDRANRVMTLGLDVYWRKKMIQFLPSVDKIYLLDCATGTGDQILSLFTHSRAIEKAIGIDLSKEMLTIARKKIELAAFSPYVSFQEASVLALPFLEKTFDCITLSFGIRNVSDVLGALKECRRVLKPSGRILILEGSIPKNRFFKPIFLFYLRHLLPLIGGMLSKNKKAYRYLNQTIELFPCGEDFCKLLREAGFVSAQATPFTFGTVTIYQGDRDGHP